MDFQVGNATLELIRGDIADVEADAIVNAANSSLMGGGGVDGAIHRKGGPRILEECKRIRTEQWPEGLPTGRAVITTGGILNAKHVIHTVGPVWRGGSKGEAELLGNAYTNSMAVAVQNGLRTVVFPSISTGTFGYPIEKASQVAVSAVKAFLETYDRLREVTFVLFSDYNLKVYVETAEKTFLKRNLTS